MNEWDGEKKKLLLLVGQSRCWLQNYSIILFVTVVVVFDVEVGGAVCCCCHCYPESRLNERELRPIDLLTCSASCWSNFKVSSPKTPRGFDVR